VSLMTHQEPEALLAKMRAGDRTAAAEFVSRFAPRIRRRIRGKLNPAMRRLFDSQEIMSTLGRRLDAFIGARRLNAESINQLWGLLIRMADNALIEKKRVFKSLEAKEGEDSPLAREIMERLRAGESHDPDCPLIEIDRALLSLGDGLDREILSLWLMGSGHVEIGAAVGLAPSSVRKRWERIRGQLREFMNREDGDE
jgi:DNA-directed RNA polymerase specialized sigma24 family protein